MTSDLNREIEFLITFICQSKKISFSKAEYDNIDFLVQEGVIQSSGNLYVIKNFPLVSVKLLEHYKRENSFEYSADFSLTVAFIKTMKDDLRSGGYFQEFIYLAREIWRTAVIQNNKQLGTDFHLYLNSINNEDKSEELFEFIEAYSHVLPTMNISGNVIYNNAIIMIGIVASDATYNMPLRNVLVGIQKKCEANQGLGMELFQLATRPDKQGDNILSAIVAGLYNKSGRQFYDEYLSTLLNSTQFKISTINGLAAIDNIEEREIKLFIDVFDREKSYHVALQPLAWLLFAILKTTDNLTTIEKYILEIFSRINEIVGLGDVHITAYILHEVAFLHKHDEQRTEVILKTIKQEYFSLEKLGKSIEQVFWYLKDVSILEKVVLAIAEKAPFKRISEYCSLDVGRFEKQLYDDMLIRLISSNKANHRFAGLDLFNKESLRREYTFDRNLVDLPPIVQYKLWMGLTQDYKEPKYWISALVPLLKSKSEIVKESLTCKLEEYTENYGIRVIDAMKKALDGAKPEDITIIKRVEEHMHHFQKENVTIKRNIHELNPFYTQNKLFGSFTTQFHKTINNKMRKSVEENSFLTKIARNIQLAKGGGWKTSNRENISKLSSVESGFALPREYFIFPNLYGWQESQKMRTNWTTEEFSELIKALENEQQ